MTDMNYGVVFGHIVRQPDLIQVGDTNLSILTFTIAVNRDFKVEENGQTQYNPKTAFLDFTVYGKRAESLQKYLTKGKPINVEYHIEQEKWISKTTGKNCIQLKLVPDKVHAFLERSSINTTKSEPKSEPETQDNVIDITAQRLQMDTSYPEIF